MMKRKSPFCLLALVCMFTAYLNSGFALLPEEAQAELQKQYYHHYFEPSDINEHLPHLRRLASEVSSVVEIGLRDMVSTWGLLEGLAKGGHSEPSYLGIDLNHPPAHIFDLAQTVARTQGISFDFWQGNDRTLEIPPTDLLFIDSLHTYCHLTYELEKFSPQVNKYIAMHDTSWPWGEQDDSSYHGDYSEYPAEIDRTKRGLWPAVSDFLDRHPEWELLERHTNNHGFTILKRTQQDDYAHPEVTASMVEDTLKNKMILCTGPSFGRKSQLVLSTENDLSLIPFKKVFISTNDPENLDVTFLGKSPVIELIPDKSHQLGCLNCIITSIKNAVTDPDCADDDILIFKHESVFINDMHLVRQAVKKLLEGHNMVVRLWAPDQFFMTNVFYMKVGAARKIFPQLQQLPAFSNEYRFCEDFFTKRIVNLIPNIYKIDYSHFTRKDNELGFFHIPIAGEENWNGYWDKSNYNDLYK